MKQNLYMIRTGTQYWFVLSDPRTVKNFDNICQDKKTVEHTGTDFVQVTRLRLSDLDEVSNIGIC